MFSNRPGKLNNHLEAAIHEAMSELDKMSGTVSIYIFLEKSLIQTIFALWRILHPVTVMFFSVRPPSDPVEGSPGEAAEA